MNRMLFDIILLSIIEGITEFLPISSTGHLIVVSEYLNMEKTFYQVFDIAIQFGAIMSVVVLYFNDFCKIAHPREWRKPTVVSICIATLPVLAIGYLLKDVIKSVLFSSSVVFIGLAVGGILMIVTECVLGKSNIDAKQSSKKQVFFPKVTKRQAFMIGIWQCLALMPGMSRSAMTIIGGRWSGLTHSVSAAFSFVVAVPVMVVVVGYDLIQIRHEFGLTEYLLTGLGMAIAFVVAYGTMRWFLSFITGRTLIYFGVYRIIIGALGLVFFI